MIETIYDGGKSISLLNHIVSDRFYIDIFCATRGIQLEDYTLTSENYPLIEAAYFFNDGLGGYTLDGIMNSLQQEGKQ